MFRTAARGLGALARPHPEHPARSRALERGVPGALAGGPLLVAALVAGRAPLGVVAAIAAMPAGINDRPGSRRTSVRRIGVPALAGAAGLLVGTYGGQHSEPGR